MSRSRFAFLEVLVDSRADTRDALLLMGSRHLKPSFGSPIQPKNTPLSSTTHILPIPKSTCTGPQKIEKWARFNPGWQPQAQLGDGKAPKAVRPSPNPSDLRLPHAMEPQFNATRNLTYLNHAEKWALTLLLPLANIPALISYTPVSHHHCAGGYTLLNFWCRWFPAPSCRECQSRSCL